MAARSIVLYAQDAATLRRKSEPVRGMSPQVRRLIRDLKDTLVHSADGIGLAAPQIGIHRRVIVVRLSAQRDDGGEPDPPIALINPKVIRADREQRDFDGCLSFPGLYAETTRPHYLEVTALDANGKRLDRAFEGFDAVVVHHEIDHLDGVLFVDRVQSIEELYRVVADENGELIRVPVQAYSI